QAIVSLYALDGEPVASGSLSKKLDIEVSTATLRNDMAALTRLGLLEQPYTSAGRVPSSAGYRYYLDFLMNAELDLNRREQKIIDEAFEKLDYDPEHLAQGAAKALSDLLGYTVVATTPRAEDMRIAHFELMQSGRFTVAVMAVTSAGGVKTRVAKTTAPLDANVLELLTVMLNRALCFVSSADVSEATLEGLKRSFGADAQVVLPVLQAAVSLLNDAGQPHTYLEGLQHLLVWQELTPILPDMLEIFGDSEKTQQMIIPPTGGVTVTLGEDLPYKKLPGLAIMSQKYLAGGGRNGAIAIIGPERMPYKKMVTVLEYFALKLGQIMSGNY
ncbi:MAG: heat-inducible transcriptional repressor HrcA, partial [Oscillospiraceae bacterium]